MSYFGQKKKQKRINIFLSVSLSLIAIVLFFALLFPDTSLFRWVDGTRFHLYLFSLFLMLYALFYRKTIYAFSALCLLVFNYTIISSSTNLCYNVLVKGKATLDVVYHEGRTSFPEIVETIGSPARRMGKVRLAPGREAVFATFRKNRRRFTVMQLDLKDLTPEETPTIYNNLSEFVLSQDEPLVLVGNFGIPAWSPVFKNFLQKTSLEVKNRILFTDGQHIFNPFCVPSVNVLAYNNVGIKSIEFQARDKENNLPLRINFELEYN